MNEKKLTDDEIIKALENGSKGYGAGIVGDLWSAILDLIHRLQSENKELKSHKFASWKLKFFNLKEEFDKELSEHEEFTKKAKAEIELLSKVIGSSKRKTKILELQKEIERLTKQREVGREKLKNEIANKIFMSASHGAIQCGKMSVAIAEIEAEKYVEFAWEMVQQAVKDTAKEMIELIDAVKEVFPNDYRGYDMAHGWSMCVDKLKEIIKSKGAEVE